MKQNAVRALLSVVCAAAGVFSPHSQAQAPVLNAGGTVSAASFSQGPFAAGSIIAVFGVGLATETRSASGVPLPTDLGGAQLLANGVAAPLFFVSPTQINAQLPWSVAGARVIGLQAVVNGVTSAKIEIPEAARAPGLFALGQGGQGQGAVLIAGAGATMAAVPQPGMDARPVQRREYVAIFGTGLGAVTNPPGSGAAALADPLSETQSPTAVTIGGISAEVLFSGLAPGFVGLSQVNVRIPDHVATGDAVPVTVTVGGVPSNTVTIAVQPAPGDVAVSPAAATVVTGAAQQFQATVTGPAGAGVVWSVSAAGAAGPIGTITPDGRYTSPAVVPEPPVVEVRATNGADPTRFSVAAVTIDSLREDWPKYRRDLTNTGFSRETGISSFNIARFKRKWRFETGARISASPAVATINGVRMVYVGNWGGNFHAVDADTGTAVWSFAADKAGQNCASGNRCRIASSPAVHNGAVYFGAENAFLYALNAATGAVIWKKQLANPDLGYEIWSSPAVHNGVVYVGLASHNAAPCVVGRVEALDAATGARIWAFDTIDQSSCPSGFCVGAGVWSSPAIDAEFGTLYIGTGNPGQGCSPSTANATRYPDGVLALDLASGTLKSFYQTFPDDPNDEGDVGATPALHSMENVNQCAGTGSVSHWVTVPTKDGSLFTMMRGASGLLGVPFVLPMSGGQAIASPAVIPFTQSVFCQPPNLSTIEQGSEILVPTMGGQVVAIRQRSQSLFIRWRLPVKICPPENPCPLLSAPAAVTDLLVFGGGEGNVYAANLAGQLVWSMGTNGLVASGPAVSHSTIYFGSYDGFLYAVSRNGQ